MTWAVRFEPKAQRQIESLDFMARRRILAGLKRLAADPYASPNVKTLAGGVGDYRLRVGDWRVLYTLDDGKLLVLVLRVGHRKEVYR